MPRYRTWFAHRGWAYDDDVAAQFTGRRADDVFRTVDGPWSGEDPDALLAEIVALEPHRRLPEPVAGAVETIEWARAAGIPLALVTSADTRWAARALEPLGGIDAVRHHRHARRHRDRQARPGLLRAGLRTARGGCRGGGRVRGRAGRRALGRPGPGWGRSWA